MTTNTQDQTIDEINKELRLLTKAIFVKLSGLFNANSSDLDMGKILKINSSLPFIRFSFLLPKSIDTNTHSTDFDVKNASKHARAILNSALSALKRELNNIVSYRFVESNLQYTGFSISPFGFTLEIPKARLVAVKIRKVTIEIIASLRLEELKQEVLCSNDSKSKLPRELVFAALRKRQEIANSFTIPHNEYDIEEIESRLSELCKTMKENVNKPNLIAS